MKFIGDVSSMEMLMLLLVLAQRIVLSITLFGRLCDKRHKAIKDAVINKLPDVARFQNKTHEEKTAILEGDIEIIFNYIRKKCNDPTDKVYYPRANVIKPILDTLASGDGKTILDNLIDRPAGNTWTDLYTRHLDGPKDLLGIKDDDVQDDYVRAYLSDVFERVRYQCKQQISLEKLALGGRLEGDSSEVICALQHVEKDIPNLGSSFNLSSLGPTESDLAKDKRSNIVNNIKKKIDKVEEAFDESMGELESNKLVQSLDLIGVDATELTEGLDEDDIDLFWESCSEFWAAQERWKRLTPIEREQWNSDDLDVSALDWTNQDDIGRWLKGFDEGGIDWENLDPTTKARLTRMAPLNGLDRQAFRDIDLDYADKYVELKTPFMAELEKEAESQLNALEE